MNYSNPPLGKSLARVLLVFLCCSFVYHVNAQSNTLLYEDSEMHHMFQYVSNPHPTSIHYFYDISAHMTDSVWYASNCLDTGNVNNWYLLYREMYYSAYDTVGLPTDTAMYNIAHIPLSNDTIPIGIIDLRYNMLTANALTSDTFFSFDTTNDLLYDQSSRPYAPYVIDTIFNASPLTTSAFFTDPVFEVSPSLILKDIAYGGGDGASLKIDFGDGLGWVAFSGTATTYYQVNYSSPGKKYIKVGVFSSGMLFESSISTITITQSLAKMSLPSITLPFSAPGLSIKGYKATTCQATEGGYIPIQKYVVYLSGIDFADMLGWSSGYFSRGADEIYTQMISGDSISQLMNYGYTFIVVKYNNSFDDIEYNAKNVVGLIDTLKKYGSYACGCDNPPPMVVIGESLGGVIGRYALRYMETSAYTTDPHSFDPSLMHNTRLFITIDAPQQGANVPLGYQHFYNFLTASPFLQSIFQAFGLGEALQYLNADATRELLKYHIETDANPGLNVSTSTYGPSPLSTHFFYDLYTMGNYPQNLKTMAISNGSFTGQGLQSPWYPRVRTANDHLFKGYITNGITIFGRHFLATSDSIEINTNPDGTGRVFFADKIAYHYKPHLFWFGLTFRQSVSQHIQIEKTAQNVLPYCVSAGSNLDLDDQVGIPTGHFQIDPIWNTLFGAQYAYTSSPGSFTLDVSLGNPWLVQGSSTIGLYTDGFNFTFIPVASSFDYNNSLYSFNNPVTSDLSHDISTDGISTTLGLTPYDMVLMNRSSYANKPHLWVDNPGLQYCSFCTTGPTPIRSYLINREIGDDSLLLFDTHDAIPWEYEAEHDVLIDYYSSYYNYPSATSSYPGFAYTDYTTYVMSKDDPCQFAPYSTAPTKIKANYLVLENTGSFTSTGYYTILPGTMHMCCVNYGSKQPTSTSLLPSKAIQSFAKVYPNPVVDNSVTVDYKFADNLPVTIWVYDIRGALIGAYTPGSLDNTKENFYSIQFPNQLAAGMYFMKISNGIDILNSKIIVTSK